jgi:hypothetical protein
VIIFANSPSAYSDSSESNSKSGPAIISIMPLAVLRGNP